MNINWEEIKERYPNSYKMLGIWIISYKFKSIGWAEPKDYEQLCYCDLEKFFDDNGIIIEILANFDYMEGFNRFSWSITGKNINRENTYSKIDYETRNEAKEQAIYKAFEILEKRLK